MSPSQRRTGAHPAPPGPRRRRRVRPAALVAYAVASVGVLASAQLSAAAQPAAPDLPSHSQAARVVGGGVTTTSANPWMVFLSSPQLYPGSPSHQFCGGTLVSARTVLTAAHCVADKSADAIQVVAGRTDLRVGDGVTEQVVSVWTSPSYTGPNGPGDVSVLTLGAPLPYQPMPLVSSQPGDIYRVGAFATVLGWGSLRESGPPSNLLRQAAIPLVSDQQCANAYGRQFHSDAMVCAGYPQGGVDTCQGDSGGPLLLTDPRVGRLVLAGIVSWGQGCAEPGYPGVYNRLATYVDQVSPHITQ